MTSPEPTPEQMAEKWLREHDGSTRQPPVPSRIALLAALIRDVREKAIRGVLTNATWCWVEGKTSLGFWSLSEVHAGDGNDGKTPLVYIVPDEDIRRALAGAGGGE